MAGSRPRSTATRTRDSEPERSAPALGYNPQVTPGTDYDVLIAGAGPGGVAMAARLLQSDRGDLGRFVLLDRDSFPRAKPCGGGLTGHAADAMAALGLTVDVRFSNASTARVRFGSYERSVELERPVRVIRREEFDASLVAQMRARGVEVVEGEGVTGYEVEAERVVVHTTAGRSLTARVLVGADGAASVVRKHLSGEVRKRAPQPHRLFKMELPLEECGLSEGRLAESASSMIYDFTPMTLGLRGYMWLFPSPGGRLNVGVMHYPVSRIGGRRLVEILRAGLASYGIELPAKGTRGWPAWGYHPSREIAGPRVLSIGDAAGIDALTGEGIAVAMEQAIVAGDAIEDAFERGDFGFRDYRRRVRRATVGRELALDRWLAWMLYRRKRWRCFLSLVLFDPQIIEMYATRVAGTRILADEKLRLYMSLFGHAVRLRSRGRALRRAGEEAPLLLEAPRLVS